MTLPDGQPRFDRVVMAVDGPLAEALETGLTGYGVIVPQAGLLGDGTGKGVLWFEDGVPVAARHTGTGRTGPEALADIAATGPFRVRLVEADPPTQLPATAEVPPAAPAEQVVGDESLASKTRKAAADEGQETESELDAVEAFLADDEKIEAIQQQAAAEARRRAEEWGFDTADRDET